MLIVKYAKWKTLGRCKDEDCDSDDNDWRSGARSLDDPQSDALLQQAGDGALMASYSVFVVEPGEDIGKIQMQKINSLRFLY